MAARRQGHRHHPASRHARDGRRALRRPRLGPNVVRLDHAGIQRRGGTGERGLLHFGEGNPDEQRH